jgi:hypothetical protein
VGGGGSLTCATQPAPTGVRTGERAGVPRGSACGERESEHATGGAWER